MPKTQLVQTIKDALKMNSFLRDSDHKLVAWIWKQEIEDTISDDVINLLNMGQLTNWETIARIRRNVQAVYKDLRGNNWEERHKKAVEVSMEMTDYKPTL
jgi:hypothetical protein